MNDAKRIEIARFVAGRMGLLAAALDAIVDDTTLIGRMRDATAGPVAQRCDSGPSGPHVADPTFVAAMRGADPASIDLLELDRLIMRLQVAVDAAWNIVDRYPPRRRANDADRLMLERINGRADPGCDNCARIDGERGGPRWEPVHPKLTAATDVGGRLPAPMWLCRWCWDCVAAWGRLPSATELQRHHRGERVAWPRDVEAPK